MVSCWSPGALGLSLLVSSTCLDSVAHPILHPEALAPSFVVGLPGANVSSGLPQTNQSFHPPSTLLLLYSFECSDPESREMRVSRPRQVFIQTGGVASSEVLSSKSREVDDQRTGADARASTSHATLSRASDLDRSVNAPTTAEPDRVFDPIIYCEVRCRMGGAAE